jgi:hypothetical protein
VNVIETDADMIYTCRIVIHLWDIIYIIGYYIYYIYICTAMSAPVSMTFTSPSSCSPANCQPTTASLGNVNSYASPLVQTSTTSAYTGLQIYTYGYNTSLSIITGGSSYYAPTPPTTYTLITGLYGMLVYTTVGVTFPLYVYSTPNSQPLTALLIGGGGGGGQCGSTYFPNPDYPSLGPCPSYGGGGGGGAAGYSVVVSLSPNGAAPGLNTIEKPCTIIVGGGGASSTNGSNGSAPYSGGSSYIGCTQGFGTKALGGTSGYQGHNGSGSYKTIVNVPGETDIKQSTCNASASGGYGGGSGLYGSLSASLYKGGSGGKGAGVYSGPGQSGSPTPTSPYQIPLPVGLGGSTVYYNIYVGGGGGGGSYSNSVSAAGGGYGAGSGGSASSNGGNASAYLTSWPVYVGGGGGGGGSGYGTTTPWGGGTGAQGIVVVTWNFL